MQRRPTNILVVDDDPSAQHETVRLLHQRDYSVACAWTLEDAYARLAEPDVYAAWLRGVHPDDIDTLQGAIERCLAAGEVDVEYRYRHPARGERWMQRKGRLLADGDGRPFVAAYPTRTSRPSGNRSVPLPWISMKKTSTRSLPQASSSPRPDRRPSSISARLQ